MQPQFYPELGEQLYRQVLPNGLTVAVVPRPGFSRKIAYFVTDYGSIHTAFALDGKQISAPAGVAHYLEHKLFDMPGRDITAEFAALGANPNAFTSYDMTAYYFSCTENFEQSLRLLLEFVSTPYFTEESVEKEREIIGQEIDMNEDSADTRVFENLMEAMYRKHPIRKPILGTRQSIAQITPQVLYECHKAFYHPGNMLLCVVGDVDPRQVVQIAEETLGAVGNCTGQKETSWQEEMTCPIAIDSYVDNVTIWKIRKYRSDDYATEFTYDAADWGEHCYNRGEKVQLEDIPRRKGEHISCWVVDDHTPTNSKDIINWLERRR